MSEAQKQTLANAGNNTDLMFSESAFIDTFNENKVLYKKVVNGGVAVFEYSTDATEELYTVTFTNVGLNNGEYSLLRTVASGPIFEYVGAQLGNYSPIIKLIAPSKVQVFVVKSDYKSSEKTRFNSEIAVSNNDANLFSTIDDNQNTALAAKIGWQEILIDKKWQDREQILRFSENAKLVGIKIKICLILGLPGEPENIVEKTIDLLKDIEPDFASVSGFLPVPGSPIAENPALFGIKKIDKNWHRYSHLLFRFSDTEEVGLPFDYDTGPSSINNFNRQQIAENIMQVQNWLKERAMVY